MAKFTAQQINNGRVINLNRWASKGGWKCVEVATMSTVDYIMSDGIYYVEVEIEGSIPTNSPKQITNNILKSGSNTINNAPRK